MVLRLLPRGGVSDMDWPHRRNGLPRRSRLPAPGSRGDRPLRGPGHLTTTHDARYPWRLTPPGISRRLASLPSCHPIGRHDSVVFDREC